MRVTRRTALLGVIGGAARAAEGWSAGRIPLGAVLRLPAPAPRRTGDVPAVVDAADAWAMALTHERLGVPGDNGMSWPLLSVPPVIDRTDARAATVILHAGMTFSDGTPVDARSVVGAWHVASGGVLGRLAMAMGSVESRSARELIVRTAAPGLLDEMLSAWPLALVGPRGAGLGPFRAQSDGAVWVRNPRCPLGGAFLDRVEVSPARSHNDELRAFTAGALDASWRGHALYEVSRPAEVVRGAPGAVVGLCPTPGGVLDHDASHARAMERMLAPIATSAGSTLGPMGLSPTGAAADEVVMIRALVAALTARDAAQPVLRLARERLDGQLDWIAERVVAILDAAGVRVALVQAGGTEPADATVRAVAPIGADVGLAVASFVAAAGDEAHASEVVRSPRSARSAAAAALWGRGTPVLLGRALPTLHVRAGVRGVRFYPDGRLSLADAWVTRSRG